MNGVAMKKLKSSEEPQTVEGVQYHIKCKPGDVAPYVLLPGDPGRVPRISRHWEVRREVARNREYVTHTGTYIGAPISATSTGIGGPAASIAVEELLRIGAHTLIRVGTTGAIREEVRIGELVIISGAVRLDGASKQLVRPEYPAAASYEVQMALIQAAEELGASYHLGVVASTDSFYTGQARPGYRGYRQSWMKSLIPDLRAAGVLSFEMEASAILTMASVYGARAGGVCAVVANRATGEFVEDAGVEDAIKVANEAVKILHSWDKLKKEKGKKHFYPALQKHPA